MRGVNAAAIVALVEDAAAVRTVQCWDRAEVQLVANAVRGLLEFGTDVQQAVSVASGDEFPGPALIWSASVNASPEFRCYSLRCGSLPSPYVGASARAQTLPVLDQLRRNGELRPAKSA